MLHWKVEVEGEKGYLDKKLYIIQRKCVGINFQQDELEKPFASKSEICPKIGTAKQGMGKRGSGGLQKRIC